MSDWKYGLIFVFAPIILPFIVAPNSTIKFATKVWRTWKGRRQP